MVASTEIFVPHLKSAPRTVTHGFDPQFFCFLAITPFERADLPLARALRRQNTAVAVDIGRDASAWPALLAALDSPHWAGIGLRIPDFVDFTQIHIPARVGFVVVAGDCTTLPSAWRNFPVLAQVCSAVEAERALAVGAQGLIAKGQESGGLSGDESSFVLLQRLVALADGRVPVWCQGGIGLNTAAAAFAGGAFGVVLDTLLAVLPECSLAEEIKTQLLAMDGSEVRLVAGYQIAAPSLRDTAGFDSLNAEEIRAALTQSRLLAIGQDAALANAASMQCPSVETLINTLRMQVAGQLHQAKALRLLDENSAWARSHGVRYPIAQGPMTRVSDTAAFCGAVSDAGALPFLALSLMQEDACRALLEATQIRVGAGVLRHAQDERLADAHVGKPWGVGVLGFAPPEILQPQLELIKTFKPSVVLLAGGRPSQARPLIALGIPTYLHVPSPGLLELFLKDGATHFVFEGRECGGHVGPRYSFVLWQQALSILLQIEQPQNLHILFAGGIHDARSSAMVAAMAAPLAALGAKIGVLMGSAYIATEEAVSCGAVIAEFQTQTLLGTQTCLVETAPGHAIRCVSSGFVDVFERKKTELREAGVDQKTAWQALEALTLGRLRIASKGLERVDETLVAVDLARQQTEGMYMIGQIIAMKNTVTTVADLHAAVSRGACEYLDNIIAPTLPRAVNAEPVAIIGMACIYPGAPDLEHYWANILQGKDAITEVAAERWSVDQYYQAGAAVAGKTPSKWGGFISDTPFDPLAFGIPPQSLAAIEPVQLLSLAVAQQALDDAGYRTRYFDREKTSVIFGAEGGMDLASQYAFRNLYPQYCGDLPPALDAVLPKLTEDSFPGVLVNVISGRIANRLGLGGVNYSVDSACASSLTAVELAVKELRTGGSDTVLAGGADFHNGINDFLQFASVGALSASGHCRSFDNNADGISLGEGVGIVVLKRLADAEQDGDRIYAVIDGVAGSSDGKGLGLTAPRKEGQKRALERAHWQAGVLPAEIGLVEAHGTGTVVGDRTELKTLTEVYNAGGAVAGQAGLGSVKSQIGHTKCAAGIAGLIKVAKALHHRVLPPTLKITQPNSAYQINSPFCLNQKAKPWPAENARAAVSAFGFGGANFHALLSAYPRHQNTLGAEILPAELFVVRGADFSSAQNTLRLLDSFVAQTTAAVALRDLACTLWNAAEGAVQIAFVARDVGELQRKLKTALTKTEGEGVFYAFEKNGHEKSGGKVAYLFSGQGSQYPNMLADLLVYFPALQTVLNAGAEFAAYIFPPTAYDDATLVAQRKSLTDTRCAQPALGMVEMAVFQWLASFGLKPDMAAGHSFGELAALAAAGAFDTSALVALASARADAILAAVGDDSGLMAAVGLSAEALRPLLADFPQVVMANQNSPVQTVISGATKDVKAACEFLKTHAVAAKIIDTACAFHSPLLAAAEEVFAQTLAAQPVSAPQWPVYSNVTAAPHSENVDELRHNLARHVVSPVRFVDEVRAMYAAGARVFVEIGPRKVLCGLVNKILLDEPHQTIALDHESQGLAGTLGALAQLAVLMPAFNANALFAGRAQSLDFTQPKLLATTTWLVNGGRAWPLFGAAPAHAAAVVLAPVEGAAATNSAAFVPDAEQAVMGYLSNMRDVVNAQRDVLMSYFSEAKSGIHRDVPLRRVALENVAAPAVSASAAVAPRMQQPAASSYRDTLLSVASERTGYPVAMLDLDLDLEADLSIDSIKRVEIIGELADKLAIRAAIGADADSLMEQLTTQKTLRSMLSWLSERLPAPAMAAEIHVETAHVSIETISIAQTLLFIVSQCTGYPVEALDVDLDLEADLSIDSIKRLEIVSQLAARLGEEASESDKDSMLESLAALKTLRAIIVWLEHKNAPVRPEPVEGSAVARQAHHEREHGAVHTSKTAIPLSRYVLRAVNAPVAAAKKIPLSGLFFVITDDGFGIAPRVAQSLRGLGAIVRVVDFVDPLLTPTDIEKIDGLVHLASLHQAVFASDITPFFSLLRAVLQDKVRYVLAASALGGDFGICPNVGIPGAGLAGLMKSAAREYPQTRVCMVDLDLRESADGLAACIVQELLLDDSCVEVAYQVGRRRVRTALPAMLDNVPHKLPLNENSVVLLTGGARGITARLAIALAQQYRCRLEIVGRSAAPTGEESASTCALTDPRQIRQVLLLAQPNCKPADIEKQIKTLLAEREFRVTMQRLQASGSVVRYTAIDVRNSETFVAFIKRCYVEQGRIDAVIHGAGIVEDKLIRDKTPESFQRVFDTKVSGALTLYRHVRDDVKFVVFFSSVASAFGNRGQCDYAAANDALDKLAHVWRSRIEGKVLSVNWGPWADTGMVSESLEKEYARKGIGLIPQAEGIDALLHELAVGAETQVVLMCGTVESFCGASSPAVEQITSELALA